MRWRFWEKRKPIRDKSRLLEDWSFLSTRETQNATITTVAVTDDNSWYPLDEIRLTSAHAARNKQFRAKIEFTRAQQEVAPNGVASPSDERLNPNAQFDTEWKYGQWLRAHAYLKTAPDQMAQHYKPQTVTGRVEDLRSMSKAAKRAYARPVPAKNPPTDKWPYV